MPSAKVIVGAIVLIGAVSAVVIFSRQKKAVAVTTTPSTPATTSPTVVSQMVLYSSAQLVTAGSAVTFTIDALNSSAKGVQGASASLYEGGDQITSFPSTDSQGQAQKAVSFATAGTYNITAKSANGKVSNSITLIVIAAPTSGTVATTAPVSNQPTPTPNTPYIVTFSDGSMIGANTAAQAESVLSSGQAQGLTGKITTQPYTVKLSDGSMVGAASSSAAQSVLSGAEAQGITGTITSTPAA